MQNRKIQQAIKHYDEAAIKLQHKEYGKAYYFEEKGHQALADIVSDEALDMHYIKALHFYRFAYIFTSLADNKAAHYYFRAGFAAFQNLVVENLSRSQLVYFAQTNFSEALIYSTREHEYIKSNEIVERAINIIKSIPPCEKQSEDTMYKLSYKMFITVNETLIHAEQSENLWEKLEKRFDKFEHLHARYTKIKLRNYVQFQDEADKAGIMSKEVGKVLDTTSILRNNSIFRLESRPSNKPSIEFAMKSIH